MVGAMVAVARCREARCGDVDVLCLRGEPRQSLFQIFGFWKESCAFGVLR